ncbi:hypothetical protein MJO28_013601 [Puccinia striiformis f. sp. tritici]|nr:hypothetical protein Pst134EA_025876 [Puccinia striiformis f. sp. tritici]KAI9615137.1 hypothetical protein H4Q26_011677 [Puccinia striiformis f. sp. tritici PST-130]KNF03609.1 hypothetical protein PSTG_03132 [Puccinia striiformis f. sp. tritici PST-78]KAH9444060.1 hypothetical protein Pst134EB_026447 [Puccinia striiformis f. sp. tritici]KAH9451938.1 hypothetical protein Pst134EA_025876 [Puccinia striiformis f. sp. tritici]KAI7939949.1 hypothetical protein MJO28_013601 [Puccinia striiformis
MTKLITVGVLTPQQDLLKQALRSLTDNMEQSAVRLQEITSNPGTVSPDFGIYADRIKTNYVPCLQRQLVQLCDLMFSLSTSDDNPPARLQDAIELSVGIKAIIEQLKLSIILFWGPSESSPSTNTEESSPSPKIEQDLTRFRCHSTEGMIADLFCELLPLFTYYRISFELSKYNPKANLDKVEPQIGWTKLVEDTRAARDWIDYFIRWLNLSDLGILQEHWCKRVQRIDKMLCYAIEWPQKNPGIDHEPMKCSIPIIKLVRMFFTKMAKSTNSEEHPISCMSADQQVALLEATRWFPNILDHFVHDIEIAHIPGPDFDDELAGDLKDSFEEPLDIVVGYLYSKPNQAIPRAQHQPFREWYTMWNDEFELAVKRFHSAYANLIYNSD